MATILDAILNFPTTARDPHCPPKFFYLPRVKGQDEESKWGDGDIWLHTEPPPPEPQDYDEAWHLSCAIDVRRAVNNVWRHWSRAWSVVGARRNGGDMHHCMMPCSPNGPRFTKPPYAAWYD